jgi:phage terminase small subunit
MDRLDEVRAAIREQGLTVKGSTGQLRQNPLLGTERDLHTSLARLLKELGLDRSDAPGGR